jgi:hypothetical protein
MQVEKEDDMRMTTGVCTLVLALSSVTSLSWADSLYRCADGTFTNKAARQCAPNESKGIVRVQGSDLFSSRYENLR